jgi:hypothetical protein
MSRVFISYARRDGIPYAEEIEQRLALHKLNPWRDITDIAAGHPWNREIDDAIADSYAMIVITTEAACKSVGVTYEWTRALTLGNTKVIVIYFPDKRNHIPQQLNTLHQLEWGHMDFWVKLTETLQRFQAEDGLVEVRIPVEADSQLKRLALQAFNNTFSWDTNVHAINALIDMPNDAVARQILINGLNSRRYRTVEHILKKMNEYGFQDECSFQKLYEILTTPKAEDTKSETRQAALRELVAEILAQWGFIVVNELSESEKWIILRKNSYYFPCINTIKLTFSNIIFLSFCKVMILMITTLLLSTVQNGFCLVYTMEKFF